MSVRGRFNEDILYSMDSMHKDFLLNAGIPTCEEEKNLAKPLIRQCMIVGGMLLIYMMQGLSLGAPTVIIAQNMKEQNATITHEMISWISTVPTIGAVPTIFILPWLSNQIGRRFTFGVVCIISIIGFSIFYTSANLYYVLFSQIFTATITAAANTVFPVIIAEYSSPKYRGIFLTLKSASTFWGIWIANTIGTFFYWKNIAIVAFAVCAYFITVLFWPESPYWLAMKGRYIECAESHRWLKGICHDSEKELATLIKSHMKHKNVITSDEANNFKEFSSLSLIWSTITSRHFYKPTLVCILLLAMFQFNGKYVISIYAIEVLKKITSDESIAFKGMLILDGFTVFSMYGGSILSRYVKRRKLILIFSIIANLFLYLISFYLFLVSISVLLENNVIVIFLLTVYSVAVAFGPLILTTTFYGEIIPLHYQAPIMIISSFYNLSMFSVLLKLSPLMMKHFLIHGYFLFYAVSSTIIIFFVYIYVPETKDKTMFEIQDALVDSQIMEEQTTNLLQQKE